MMIFQRVINYTTKIGSSFIKLPQPKLLSGKDSLNKLPEEIENRGSKKVLIVSGKHVSKTEIFKNFLNSLQKNNIEYKVFSDVEPNPSVKTVIKTKEEYKNNNCDSIAAFGGGSALDCAKIAAALSASDKNTVSSMRGYFKVKGKLPPLFAVPTTAGTGSEVTVCAVITDSDKGDKYAISDIKLIPKIAVLDPVLTVSMPPKLTAETGMDALTHAVEAYIGVGGTKYTDKMAEKAVKLIFENLYKAFENGEDLEAREDMATASYYAGCAFTLAFVGYVHAIAHSLGGKYNVPHGFANAVILPYVLEYYGKAVYKKLARLAVIAGLGSSSENEKELAERFISKIKELNKKMNIPTKIQEIKKEDIPELAAHAQKEANPHYPVPVILNENELSEIFLKLI